MFTNEQLELLVSTLKVHLDYLEKNTYPQELILKLQEIQSLLESEQADARKSA